MQEAAREALSGRGAGNGLRRTMLGKKLQEPEAASAEGLRMEHRVGSGLSTSAFGVCRPPLGEMPHWCLECGKNFGQKADLEKHQGNHARQCSYICSDCGRSFTDHPALPSCRGGCPAASSFGHAGCPRKSLPPPGETIAPRKERKELSLQEKVRVLEVLEGPKVSQSELAKRFGVSQPQICRIIKNKERILAEWCQNSNPGRKRKLEQRGATGEAALLQWFEHSCTPSLSTHGAEPKDKARALAETFGKPELHTWLAGLKSRQKARRERPRAERPNGECPEEEPWGNGVPPSLLSRYDPSDIYACGETGLLFRATPEALGTEHRSGAEDRLTVLLCTNWDASDKREPLIVGKGPAPFCFRVGGEGEPPVTYRAHSQSWMTPAIFSEWLQKFNTDMKRKQKSVALFLVPCAAHPSVELSNVKVVDLPLQPRRLRPLEQGILQAFKGHYRQRTLTRLAARLDSQAASSPSVRSKQVTLLDAVHMILQAWMEVCPQTVTNSFRAAGFGVPPRVPAPPGDVLRALGFLNQEQFERFVLVDEGLECFGEQDGVEKAGGDQRGEGLTHTMAVEEGEGAKDSVAPSCPSKAEVLESLAKLRRYFECRVAAPAVFQTFYKLEDVVHGMCLADRPAAATRPLPKE